MTHAEAVFYERLCLLLGDDYRVFPQMHWSAIFEPELKRQWWRAAFSHINGKSVDFVVCDRQLRPLYAIELDDWSHSLQKRKLRDAELQRIVRDSHFPLIRINGGDSLSDEELASRLDEAAHALKP